MAGRRIILFGGYAPSLLNFRGPLIRALAGAGHQVLACAPEDDAEVAEKLRALGAEYHSVPLSRTGLNPLADARSVGALTRVFRGLHADVFLGYTIKPVIYGSAAARLAGVRDRYAMITGLGYAFGRGTARQRILGALVTGLYRAALSGSRAVFFQNPDDAAEFTSRGIVRGATRPVLINGSGVDLDHYRPAPPVLDGPVFLLIARMIPEKGVNDFVEAARSLKRRYPAARFQLLGPVDTNSNAIPREVIAGWEAEGVIEYLGAQGDVRPALAGASVFVLPSFYREGTPRTILEALSTGRPVVTCDAPGCRETVIPGRNGFLVPTRSPEALAAALERFAAEPQLIVSMGEAGLELARTRYDVHAVNASIMGAMGL